MIELCGALCTVAASAVQLCCSCSDAHNGTACMAYVRSHHMCLVAVAHLPGSALSCVWVDAGQPTLLWVRQHWCQLPAILRLYRQMLLAVQTHCAHLGWACTCHRCLRRFWHVRATEVCAGASVCAYCAEGCVVSVLCRRMRCHGGTDCAQYMQVLRLVVCSQSSRQRVEY